MWSGPRNISTAMMRSWGSRPDTVVCDEPLYAHYLRVTGAEHPGRDEVIAHHESDWRTVTEWLTGPTPEGRPIFYQKHMAHHLLPDIGREWLDRLTHAFLIRDPDAMLASLGKRVDREVITLDATGLPQQVELFDQVAQRCGSAPPVVDARDVLSDPRATLSALCASLRVPFCEAMHSWQPGPRATDGIWAKHWYDAVEASTGFGPPDDRAVVVPEDLRGIAEQARELYDRLASFRLCR